MTGADGMSATETIGQTLARLREARGLDVRKVAEELRCDRRIIEALEADRYADLGAAVFARGHLRRYADHLGAPTEALLVRWSAEQATHQTPPDLTRAPQAPRPIDTRRWGRLLAVVAGALAIGLAAWWILQGAGARPTPPVAQPVAALSAPVPVPAQPVTDGSAAQAASVPMDSTAQGVTTTPQPTPPPASTTAVPSVPVAAVPASSVAATSAASTPPPSAPVTAPQAAVAGPGEIAMAFTTQADCWAEVFDAQGGRRLYQIIRAGQRVTATGKPPLRVTLGRGDVTRLEIDGRTAAIPADAVRDAVARFEIGASGAMRALPPVPAPTATPPAAAAPAAATPTTAEAR